MPVVQGKVGKYQTVKVNKRYPWPCEGDPNRMIPIFNGDVLKRTASGIFNKVSGLGLLNIHIPEEDILECEDNDHYMVI